MKAKLRSEKGFTFIEVMVAISIVSIAAVGIMIGTVHAKGELRALQVREKATDKLSGYTEYWKGRIASGTLSTLEKAGDLSGEKVILIGDDNNQIVTGKLFYDIEPEPSNHMPPYLTRMRLKTWIEWDDHVFTKNKAIKTRRLETVMIEFKFS